MQPLKFDIYQDKAKADKGLASFSFRINGQESMMWSSTLKAAERIVNRLRDGKSGEAFGGAGIVSADGVPLTTAQTRGHDKGPRAKIIKAGEVVTEVVKMKSGREKVREKQPGFIYELDGKVHESEKFTDEHTARGYAASEAFATRGRLGRFAEAERQFKDERGKACKVQVLDLPGSALHRKIVAKDQDGGIWHVGFDAGVNRDKIKFTPVVPAPPKDKR